MELGHVLTRSGLTYPEVSSKVCHDSFCQLGNSVPWDLSVVKISPEWVTGTEQGKSSGRIATFSLWTGVFRDGISSIPDETVIPLWLCRHFFRSCKLLKDSRINREWWIRKEMERNSADSDQPTVPAFFLRTEIVFQYSRCLGQDSNWMPLEYKCTAAAHMAGRFQSGYFQSTCGNSKDNDVK